DARDLCQCRIIQFVFPEHCVKRAMTAVVRQSNAWNVEWFCAGRQMRIAWDECKLCFRINETTNEPRTGHSVDANILPCHPLHDLLSPFASSAFLTLSPSFEWK